MADRVILNQTNTEFYEANVRKKRQANRTGTQYDGKKTQHLSLEEVKWRRQFVINKEKELEAQQIAQKSKRDKADLAKTCKKLMRLGLNLVGLVSESMVPAPSRASRAARHGESRVGQSV